MGSRSTKDEALYKRFREEAVFVLMKGKTENKRCIKWRGKIFFTASMVQVFNKVKNEI